MEHPQRQRRAEQDELRLSGEWRLHKIGNLFGHAFCADKQGVGNVAICADWAAANSDAVGAELNV